MQLTLVRHGEASPAIDHNDIKRPLTALGHAQAKQTAQFLKDYFEKNSSTPDIFVVSPLLRAQETLAHLQAFYADVPVMICDLIKPDDEASQAVDWLSQLQYENIVVVCHMNVIGFIDEQLTAKNFQPFLLAEARIYEQSVIMSGLSTEKSHFIPNL